jgi:transposase
MAAVALANGLDANLVRRWVVTEERAQHGKLIETATPSATSTVEHHTFIPIPVERAPVSTVQEVTIELRRGDTLIKVALPLAAAAECTGWLRELLR